MNLSYIWCEPACLHVRIKIGATKRLRRKIERHETENFQTIVTLKICRNRSIFSAGNRRQFFSRQHFEFLRKWSLKCLASEQLSKIMSTQNRMQVVWKLYHNDVPFSTVWHRTLIIFRAEGPKICLVDRLVDPGSRLAETFDANG